MHSIRTPTLRLIKTICRRHNRSLRKISKQLITSSPFIPTIRSILQDFAKSSHSVDSIPPSSRNDHITVCGWVRSARHQKKIAFLEVDDGTTVNGIQAVIANPELAQSIHTGSSVKLMGHLNRVEGRKQDVELQVTDVELIGSVDPNSYPLHKARVSLDHLRMHQEFRSRSRLFGAIWRIRNAMIQASHDYFRNLDFVQVTTPILTSHDCEGGGEVFQVVTKSETSAEQSSNEKQAPMSQLQSFFGNPVYTTVSGQLHLEILASAISRVYTLGPTFRAEPSDSARHLAEFWMLEAEMSFINSLENQLIPLIQGYVQHVVNSLLHGGSLDVRQDLDLLNQFVDTSLLDRLNSIASHKGAFTVISYSEAVSKINEVAHKPEGSQKGKLDLNSLRPAEWGQGLSYEHERYLAEEVAKGPVFITHYPKDIKPFYMKLSDPEKSSHVNTVACTDLLVPKWGELVGGSLREDNPDRLTSAMTEKMSIEPGSDPEMISAYDWYVRLREYGSTPHGGFGIGIERLLGFVTGMRNVRDLIPFPRAKSQCRF